jgi:hypothetical protein
MRTEVQRSGPADFDERFALRARCFRSSPSGLEDKGKGLSNKEALKMDSL